MTKKNVSIFIPTHNAEKNISFILDSLLKQKQDNFRIDQIFVACDGCYDRTLSIVSDYEARFALIKPINDGRHLGKTGRLNSFFASLNSDIGVVLDDDIRLKNDSVICELVKVFDNSNVGLAGGVVIPRASFTFIAKSLTAYERYWSEVIMNLNRGNNVHSHVGPIMAGSRNFLKQVRIPQDIIAEDHFLYFKALQMGYEYRLAKTAGVYFKVPARLDDFVNQTTRNQVSHNNIKKYFGEQVDKEYYIPPIIKLRAYSKIFLKSPLYLLSALILQAYQRLVQSKYQLQNSSAIWKPIPSTK